MPKGIPLTEEELSRRRREIFTAAMHLFVEKGFNRDLDARDRRGRRGRQIHPVRLLPLQGRDPDRLSSWTRSTSMTAQAQEIIAQDTERRREISPHPAQAPGVHAGEQTPVPEAHLRDAAPELREPAAHPDAPPCLPGHAVRAWCARASERRVPTGQSAAGDPRHVLPADIRQSTRHARPARPEEMLQEAFDIIFKGLEA